MGRRVPPLMYARTVLTPERQLWRAVLEQACMDAENPPEEEGEVCDQSTRTCARRFLRAAGPCETVLLSVVCELADVPFDRVVLWARQHIPNEPLTAEELASPDYWELHYAADFLA